MSKRTLSLLLEDMVEACLKVKKYTAAYDFKAFTEDEKTIDAVVRNFEIIGEAANRIDASYKETHAEIAWDRLRGLRNRIVNEYFGVDLEIIRIIIKEDLDMLVK
ncbi:MAG: DUF86 domain-containing protein [Cyclobacteriaceae bacterium]